MPSHDGGSARRRAQEYEQLRQQVRQVVGSQTVELRHVQRRDDMLVRVAAWHSIAFPPDLKLVSGVPSEAVAHRGRPQ